MLWLTLIGSFVLVGLLYGQALGFSFLFDDTFDLPRVEERSYLSLLTSSEGYSYYRPGPFLLWKLSYDLLGYYSAPLLHGLTLTAHALAGWLLYLLVSRLGAGHWAVIPALLFLTFPFSYQNVAIVGTLFHPLAGAAILASLNLYLSARRATGRRVRLFHLGALAATVVALWSHESGVVVAALIVGLEAIVMWQSGQRRPSMWVADHAAATLAFILAWLTVERTPSAETVVLADMHPKALFFAQGFTYPLSAQIQWLERETGWSPGIAQVTLLSLVLVIGACAASWWRTRRENDLLISSLAFPLAALAVAGIASLPAMARLSWTYVQDAPRLLYLVGAGAAVFWGLLPALDFGRRSLTVAWRAATIGLLVAVVAQSWVFVNVRMDMFAAGSEAVDGIVSAGERHAGHGLLVENAPSWLAQREYEYPYGHLGAQVIPSYIGLDRVIYTSSRRSVTVDATSIALDPDVDGDRFTFGPHGAELPSDALRDGRVVVVVERHGDRFSVREVGSLLAGAAEDRAQLVEIENGRVWAGLLRSVADARGLTVYLSWNLVAVPDQERIVVEVLSSGGVVAGRYEGAPLSGLFVASLWHAGDRVDDSYRFERPPAGVYTVRAGLGSEMTAIGQITVP